jgi:hypothetical protein
MSLTIKLIMKLGPLPEAFPDALEPGFQCVRAHWIRGFIAFQLARRTRSVRLTSPVSGPVPPGCGNYIVCQEPSANPST